MKLHKVPQTVSLGASIETTTVNNFHMRNCFCGGYRSLNGCGIFIWEKYDTNVKRRFQRFWKNRYRHFQNRWIRSSADSD
jgi:hypothetical protein